MLSNLKIEEAMRSALEEDLGAGGDVTSSLCLPAGKTAKAVLVTREHGILAGLIVALSAFSLTDPGLEMIIHAQDGGAIEAGQKIAEIEGDAASILVAERTALNFLTHMSGIATLTARYVQGVENTDARICATRKTLPGLRAFQKYAVQVGGGYPHRFGLGDALLIKDNHIAVAGGIGPALDAATARKGHTLTVEIEVDTLEQLREVLDHGGADSVLLDNMEVKTLQKAVELAKGQIITEVSGGITLRNVKDIAETGVEYISVGALTHSARVLDIGLDINI